MDAPAMIHSLSDLRRYFYLNETPIYYVCHMSFYLMGMDEWVSGFRFINLLDCFDGAHPRIFVPEDMEVEGPVETLEQMNNYLLRHPAVRAYIRERGPGGKVLFLMFDEETEALCKELGLELILPSAALRREVDSKVTATRLAERAGVASVPHVLTRVASYAELREKAGHLGPELVIQTPFGDSGTTTFFVASEEDWAECAEEVQAEPEVKVMKRIRCRQAALEACVTRHGTLSGPLMTEIVGFPELTPFTGGWAGNEISASAFSKELRVRARDMAERLGDELQKVGYRGYFEIDLLVDTDSGELYLGEINPRVTGATSMTNLAAFAHADAPLFLFHLLEYSKAEFDLDLHALSERWADPNHLDDWSQLIIKHTEDSSIVLEEAPRSGVWRLQPDGSAQYRYMQMHRRTVEREDEAFFLRVAAAGETLYQGWDIGVLVMPGRLMTPEFALTERAKTWIRAMRAQFRGRPA